MPSLIQFASTGNNQLGLDGPGMMSFVWDDIGFSFDKLWKINDSMLGIDIPRVDAGFEIVARATARLVVEMGYDAGTADIHYALNGPSFTGNNGTFNVNGEDLAFYRYTDAKFDTGTISFAEGDIIPIAGNPANNYLNIGLQTELYAAVQNPYLSVNLPWPLPDIDVDFPINKVVFIDSPLQTNYIYQFTQSNLPDLSDPDGVVEGYLELPQLVGQNGVNGWDPTATTGGPVLPGLVKEGDAEQGGPNGTFFNFQLDLDRALSNALGIPNLNDTVNLVGGLSLSYNLIDADFNLGLKVSQELNFVVDGVGISVDAYVVPYFGADAQSAYLSEHFEGMLGDTFTFDMPSGQGVMEYHTTYTLYGHYISEAGIKVVGALDFSALGFSINNTIGPDFSVGFGPLIDLTIPDPAYETPRLDLYEKSKVLTFNTAEDVYRVWFEQPMPEGTDGNDVIAYTNTYDDPNLPGPPDPDVPGETLPVPNRIHGYQGDDKIIGNAFRNLIWGDGGDDQLLGNGGNDEIWAGAGDDKVDGGEGADVVFAGPGKDQVWGDDGADEILGLGGDDVIYGGNGNDKLSTGLGSDTIYGGYGDDIIYLDNLDGSDAVSGDQGFDRVVIDARSSTVAVNLFTALQIDPETYQDGFALLPYFTLADGTQLKDFEAITYLAGFGNDILVGADEDDVLSGGGGDDYINWSFGADTLNGGVGDDTVYYVGMTGPDKIDGGKGVDTFLLSLGFNYGDIVIDMADNATGTVATLADGTTFTNFEVLNVDPVGLLGVTYAEDITLRGGDYNDFLRGGSGNDVLQGRGGKNLLDGGDGNDTIISNAAGDTIKGGYDTDLLTLDRTDTKLGLSFDLTANQQPGAGVATLLDNTKISGIENLIFLGGKVSDIITGGVNDDVLYGNQGNDVLDGGAGVDFVFGGDGNDYVYVSRGEGRGFGGQADVLNGDDGFDFLIADVSESELGNYLDLRGGGGTFANGVQFSGFERFDIRTGMGADYIIGGDADPAPRIRQVGEFPDVQFFVERITGDTIHSGGGDDTIDGGAGADYIDAGAGNDTVFLSTGADLINGGAEPFDAEGNQVDRDTLVIEQYRFSDADQALLATFVMPKTEATEGPDGEGASDVDVLATGQTVMNFEQLDFKGGVLNETVTGREFDDKLSGAMGDDVLTGLEGNDLIDGGDGDDMIYGGGGDDVLRTGGGRDEVYGGEGNDQIQASRPAFLEFPQRDVLMGEAGDDTITWFGTLGDVYGGAGTDTLIVDRSGLASGFTIDLRPGDHGVTVADDGSRIGGFECIQYKGSYGNDNVTVNYEPETRLDGGLFGQDVATIDMTKFAGTVNAHWDTINGVPTLIFNNGMTVQRFDEIKILEGAGGFFLIGPTPPGQPAITVQPLPPVGPVPVNGSAFSDSMIGNNGDDYLNGLGGNDKLSGRAGDDRLYGGDGNDVLDGGLGADRMYGGAGDDTYIVDNTGDEAVEAGLFGADPGGVDQVRSSVSFTLGANLENLALTGTDAIDGVGNSLANRVSGNAFANVLSGRSGDDILSAAAGDDTLRGGDGADNLDGGAGADLMYGGEGNDNYVVDDAGDVVSEETTAGVDDGGLDNVRSSASFTLGAFLENLTLAGAGAVNGTGNGLANRLIGNGAANSLYGLDGDDQLVGGGGDDALYGGSGNDNLDGGVGADTMYGRSGNDIYTVDDAGDVVSEETVMGFDDGGLDAVRSTVGFTLGAFVENLTLLGVDAIDGTGNALANRIVGNGAANVLSGAAGDDILQGGAGDDVLYGGFGSDSLDGGQGADIMNGGDGNDTYTVDNVGDEVREGPDGGVDTVLAGVDVTLGGFIENLILTGSGVIDGTGNGLANKLTGNAAANRLDGGAGDDALTGGLGDDVLIGGAGLDFLVGGDGADSFVFGAASAASTDKVGDFQHGLDRLLFTASDYGLATGALNAANFQTGATATLGHAQFLFNAVNHTLYWDADGIAGGSVAIATFGTVTVTASDFWLS